MRGFHYIDRYGEQRGPINFDDLYRLHQENQIHDDTLVLEEGQNKWKPYSQTLAPAPMVLPAPPLRDDNHSAPAVIPSVHHSPALPQKSFSKAFFLCLFLGIFGAHRFYLGVEHGLFQFLTLGGLGIWTLVDLVRLLTNDFPNGAGGKMHNSKPKVTWAIFLIAIIVVGRRDHGSSWSESESGTDSTNIKPQGAILGDTGSAERFLKQRIESTTDANVLTINWFRPFSNNPPLMGFNGQIHSPRHGRVVFFNGYVTVRDGAWDMVEFKIER